MADTKIPEEIVNHLWNSTKAMSDTAHALDSLKDCREKDAAQNDQHWKQMIETLNNNQVVHKAETEILANSIVEASKNYKLGIDSLTTSINGSTSEAKELRTTIVSALLKISMAAVAAVIILAGAKAIGLG